MTTPPTPQQPGSPYQPSQGQGRPPSPYGQQDPYGGRYQDPHAQQAPYAGGQGGPGAYPGQGGHPGQAGPGGHPGQGGPGGYPGQGGPGSYAGQGGMGGYPGQGAQAGQAPYAGQAQGGYQQAGPWGQGEAQQGQSPYQGQGHNPYQQQAPGQSPYQEQNHYQQGQGSPQGQDPYAQQAAGQDPYAQQPAGGGGGHAASPVKKKILGKVLGGLGAVGVFVVVAAIKIGGVFAAHEVGDQVTGAPRIAAVGDCMAGQDEDSLKVVDCKDATVEWKVAQKVNGLTQAQFKADKTLSMCLSEKVTNAYWGGRSATGALGWVLCLAPVKN